MGVVHLAEGDDGRRVALKVLRPHIVGDDEARERLAREVSSLRRVKSPRIAEIIDADPWGETPFVATRYVPGLSLHQHVKQEGPVTGDDLRWFAAGLAEAVIAVHTVGVLHRDIKPSNILLEGRAPVLIDFGLARLAEDPRLTVTGWLLGTPGYLAPEILYGDDATTASDVHSWAATVVFAATGHPPFGSGPAMAIMDRVRRGEHDLSAVPPDILPLVRQCLSPDPLKRPETSAVLADLRRSEGGSDAGGRGRGIDDSLTMPFSLFAAEDDDPTDVLDSVEPDSAPPPTRPLTVRMPQGQPIRPLHEPARAPYVTPPPPQQQQYSQPRSSHLQHGSYDPRPSGSPGLARVQRICLLFGLWALVAVGFALAPYLFLGQVAIGALAIRTGSWITDSARERQYRRGRARWYDGVLSAASSPWYLLVATGGTLVLLVWAVVLAVIVGLAYLLLGLPVPPGLLLMGGVLGAALWWGPGSRRLRTPARRMLVRATGQPPLGWASLAVLAAGVLVCALALANGAVSWEPAAGPPWRPGTMLGEVVGFL